ncbi:hypothetical protein FGRMN_2332 [Fusarium graminum]|nr:hypothetical protein FGRMN_2332 [Fusarium graminum]
MPAKPKTKPKGKTTKSRRKIVIAREKVSRGMRKGQIMTSKRALRTDMAQFNTWKSEFKKAVVKSNVPAIPFTPFARLCKEIMQECSHGHKPLRAQKEAIRALLEASETFLTSTLEGVHMLCVHAGRKTIMKKDFQTLYRVAGTMKSSHNQALWSTIDQESSTSFSFLNEGVQEEERQQGAHAAVYAADDSKIPVARMAAPASAALESVARRLRSSQKRIKRENKDEDMAIKSEHGSSDEAGYATQDEVDKQLWGDGQSPRMAEQIA